MSPEMPAPQRAQSDVQRDPTDVMLFEALVGGDEHAMTEIVQRHERWVRALVYGVLGHQRELEDVVQQVWLNVWKRADSLKTPAHWRTWMYRLARNTAIDSGRRTTRRRGLLRRFTEKLTGNEMTDMPRAHRDMVMHETHAEVLQAIEALSPIYREPFVLRHLEDWTYKEISEALSLPINTVEIRLVRARRKLREALADIKD